VANPEDDAGMEAAAIAFATGLDPALLTATAAHPTEETVQVTLAYEYSAITPLLSQAIGGGSITIQSSSTMYWQY
jgi:hypothetical protein